MFEGRELTNEDIRELNRYLVTIDPARYSHAEGNFLRFICVYILLLIFIRIHVHFIT